MKENLTYSTESPSGLFWNNGKVAGTLDGQGYYMTQLNKVRFKNHRYIWELFNGPIPEGFQIDHIDGNRSNNRLENLRVVSPSENSRNKKLQSNNTSGVCKLTHREDRKCIVIRWTDENMIRRQKTFGYSRSSYFEALSKAHVLLNQVNHLYSERHGK